MKKKVLLLVCFVSLVAQAQQKQPATVILTAGQSNADGRVPVDELPEYIDQAHPDFSVADLHRPCMTA